MSRKTGNSLRAESQVTHLDSKRLHPSDPQVPRRLVVLAILFGLSAVGSAYVWADWYYGLPIDAEARFVGRNSCIECHREQHTSWEGSHHDLAMDLATSATVLGDFNDVELKHHGDLSRMFKREGKFFVNTEGPDGKLADFEVKYVFGVDPLQQYMVEFDRTPGMKENEVGRLQVLRISWDTRNKRWFHLDPPDVKEKLEPTDELHWTGLAQRWNHMCADCHSTDLKKNYDVASGKYHTSWSEIDVSCEACHGPGSLHVEQAKSKSLFWDRTRGYALAKLKGTSNVPQIQACAPCHSRRRIVAPDYTAGCNYYDYFSNEVLTATAYHADGQILDEVYEYTSFLESKMFHKNVKCSDCHDPHSAQLKHTGNQVCTSCHQHPAGKYDGTNHHRHPMGSIGAQCVECHMPQATYMDVDPRRDHSFRVPRPDLSVKLATPNACSRCHLRDERLPLATAEENQQAVPERPELKEYAQWLLAASRGDEAAKAHLVKLDRWADRVLDIWYGKTRKKEPHFAEALHAARGSLPEAPVKLSDLLVDRNQPAVARATAALELAPFVEPGNKVSQALRAALSDRDVQVKAAAILGLQQEGSNDTVSALIPLLSDSSRVIRTEAARALALIQPERLTGEERQAYKTALDECFASAEVDNDRAAGHMSLGILYESLGQTEQAEKAYQTALKVEPGSIGPRTNLAALYDQRVQAVQQRAMQLAQSGNRQAAMEAFAPIADLPSQIAVLRDQELGLLERDAVLAPDNAQIQGRIGLARYLGGWRKEAESAMLTAALLEPRNPDPWFRLAVYYRDLGRASEAGQISRRLLEMRPDSRMFRQFAEELASTPAARPAGN